MPKAGRPEKALPPAADQLSVLVHELRELRRRSGLTYRELARSTGLAVSTLSAAVNGRNLPSWSVTRAYTVACDGDVRRVRALWQEAVAAAGRPVPSDDFSPSENPPDPGTAQTPGDFVELLRQLRAWANGPSLSTLNARSGGHLPPSTVSENLQRNRLPRLDFVSAFASACALDEDQVQLWKDAWSVLKSREADRRRRNGAEVAAVAAVQPSPPDPVWIARSLRRLVLVDEGVLDQVPDERRQYTRLGAAVLCAALFTALAVVGGTLAYLPMPWIILVVPAALVWALLGVWFDGSIIHRTRAAPGRIRGLGIIAPRILIGILTGTLMAGLVTITVFRSTVNQQVQASRASAVASYGTELRNCNPVVPPASIPPSCASYVLSLGRQTVLQARVADLKSQQATLLSEIHSLQSSLNSLEYIARAECNGVQGAGLSGTAGYGPNCERDQQEADAFVSQARLPDRQAELSRITNEITTQSAQVSSLIITAISKYVAAARSHQHDKPGVTEQEAALQRLASGNSTVFTAQLLILALLVSTMILPLIMSWLMPRTAYDRLANQQLDEHAQAAEAERRARIQEDLTNAKQLAGQITNLVERLPRSLAEIPSPDITELLISLTRIQTHLSGLTQTHSAEPPLSGRRWGPLPNTWRRSRTSGAASAAPPT